MLLIGQDLPDSLREKALQRIGETEIEMTGQNRVWVAGIVLKHAVMRGEPKRVSKARDAILGEIKITTGEGLQPDFSFYQHGPQLMSWSYGQSFLVDSVRWWQIFDDTPYALSDRQQRLLSRYLLDGIAWSAWHGYVDVSLRGRSFTRGLTAKRDGSLLAMLDQLQTLDPAQAEQYRQLEAFHRGKRSKPVILGNRHFWRSDYMTHRRANWFASVRMHSKRTRPTETGTNSENVKGHYLADGALMLYSSGWEYRNIWPVWDWQRVPGVTAPDYDEHPHEPGQDGPNGAGFVGAVSDDRHGAAVMRLDRRGVKANKAWFFFDGAVVCLGNGISADKAAPVITTLNQMLQDGDVRVKATGKSATVQQSAKREYANAEWLHHDGVGYVLLGDQPVTVAQQVQEGSWYSINRHYSKEPVERDVFSAWVSHGKTPDDSSYAYLLLPNVASDQIAEAAETKPVKVLANAKQLQAVAHREQELVQAIFHEAGAVKTEAFGELRVDQPCAVIVRQGEAGLELHVADPTQQLERVTVSVDGDRHAVDLPQGPEAGRTATVGKVRK
jgi:chondroitin AC lyase